MSRGLSEVMMLLRLCLSNIVVFVKATAPNAKKGPFNQSGSNATYFYFSRTENDVEGGSKDV